MPVGVYSEEQLLSEHAYARPHEIGGVRCHGGFADDGTYIPPRSRVRAGAMRVWREQLERRGGEPLRADASLLAGARVPTAAQQRLLLHHGLGQTFWNTLTITGKIEARGRVLATVRLPELQDVVVEDVSAMAVGHLNKGLLRAHGLDEGGEPEKGIGGHDAMWFALRDLAFGPGAHPDVEPPERIDREPSERILPEISASHAGTIYMLMNLLIIEFRAELGFAFSERVLLDPELFVGRRRQAEEAAEVVRRIRLDEEIHVESLRLYLGELRSCTFRTQDGGTRAGHALLDPLWDDLVHWATVEQPAIQARQTREVMTRRILQAPDGARILAEFEALAEPSRAL